MGYNYIDNKTLINDFKMVIKVPALRAALFHKIEEYKIMHDKYFDQHQEKVDLKRKK